MNDKKQNKNEKLDRRAFLLKTGKLLGLGMLAHFSLVGEAKQVNETPERTRKLCKILNLNTCDGKYNCTATEPHSCGSRFDCNGTFTCSANAYNTCLGNAFVE